ncbi:hypothetical protein DVH24_035619 [Malus domestica]|uniref:Helicase C-terminal domain-containing protein n=1 Tax=Malus domestica TaxID=3750 RepID=A0A498JUT7_MALDO|nr:hypothetical protein DVH24_035619 [Malus domestica]
MPGLSQALDNGAKDASSVNFDSAARQMVMFRATWPPSVHQLAQEFMDPNPVKVVVGSEDLAANHDVMQIVEVLDEHSCDGRLVALVEKCHKSKSKYWLIISHYFILTCVLVNPWRIVFGPSVVYLYDGFHLIATDVVARGLDIPNVEVVINYSFLLTTEDYVRRIGWTGRAGKKGVAHTFFTHRTKGLAGEMVNVLREASQIVPEALLKFGTHESKLYGAHFKEIPADAPKSQKITFNSDDED